jgi:predicted AlkP superfamily pyrophosphatase or phosphodiesterase
LQRTIVVLVVGLTPSLMGPNTPHLSKLAQRGALQPLRTVTPAVTCAAQSTFVTGLPPSETGIVGNGWYFRDLSEIWFWRQSNKLVAGEKIWDAARARDPDFTCAKLFWWYNMYADVDWAVTPRPMYPADGRKLPDIHAKPEDLRGELNGKLGQFPLFRFWGPAADLIASDWITRSALHMRETRDPTLTMVYLPHLDYCLQKYGPDAEEVEPEVRAVDALCGQLIEQADKDGTRIIVLSEYGITNVTGPVHINRALRQAGLIQVREEEHGREILDPGASAAFAIADHQIAHIHVPDPERREAVKALIEGLDGVEVVLDEAGKRAYGLDHPRAGDLVAISRADRWFTYYYWLDDEKAPDYARTVEIHRKPGFDPVELFMDPAIKIPALAIGRRLAKKALGFRTLMDVIPLDASLVKGSHGRITDRAEDGPLIISSEAGLLPDSEVAATDVKQIVLDHIFGP